MGGDFVDRLEDRLHGREFASLASASGTGHGRQLRQCARRDDKQTHKAEVIWRRRPWRNFETVEFATLEWVDWFNNKRLLEPIGNITPAEAEARYYALIEERALAA